MRSTLVRLSTPIKASVTPCSSQPHSIRFYSQSSLNTVGAKNNSSGYNFLHQQQQQQQQQSHQQQHQNQCKFKEQPRTRYHLNSYRLNKMRAAPYHFVLKSNESLTLKRWSHLHRMLMSSDQFYSNIACWNEMFKLLVNHNNPNNNNMNNNMNNNKVQDWNGKFIIEREHVNELMKDFGLFRLQKNEDTYNLLLKIHLKYGYDLKETMNFFYRSVLDESFTKFDQNTLYQIMKRIKSSDWATSENYVPLFDFFNQSRALFVVPVIAAYNDAIQLRCQLNQVDEAMTLLNEVLNGNVLKPTVQTFAPVVQRLCSVEPSFENIATVVHYWRKARNLLKSQSRNIHNTISQYLATNSGPLLEYLHSDMCPDVNCMFVLSALSYSTIDTPLFPLCKQIFEIAKQRKLHEENPEPENALLRIASVEGDTKTATKIFQQMLYPDITTFDLLIYGFNKAGHFDKAQRIQQIKLQYIKDNK